MLMLQESLLSKMAFKSKNKTYTPLPQKIAAPDLRDLYMHIPNLIVRVQALAIVLLLTSHCWVPLTLRYWDQTPSTTRG